MKPNEMIDTVSFRTNIVFSEPFISAQDLDFFGIDMCTSPPGRMPGGTSLPRGYGRFADGTLTRADGTLTPADSFPQPQISQYIPAKKSGTTRHMRPTEDRRRRSAPSNSLGFFHLAARSLAARLISMYSSPYRTAA